MKKYSSGSFVDAALRVYGSEADTISSFPASIIADGENASAVIYGNLQQSGTPTPAIPIYPSECGDLETEGAKAGQYKIPILNNSQTTNIYLGETQTTRKIKKYVFTGEENISLYSASATRIGFYYNRSDAILNGRITGICSHFKPQASPASSTIDGITFGANDINFYFTFSADSVSTYSLTDTISIKAWLATQYTNQTPVTIWYVLATEETGLINEPIRKIGDYADSVAAASIPTNSGSQTFNVNTALKPSSVSLTYTGWHTHSDKQYSGGSWGALTSGQILRRKRTTKKKT